MKRFLYILCAACFLTGCGGKKPQTEAAVEEVQAEAESPEEPQESKEEMSEEQQFRELFEIQAEGIDYLSVAGIQFPEGSTIAMIGKDSASGFWKCLKEGAEQAVEDLNLELGYSGDARIKLDYDAPDGEDVAEQIDIIDQMLDKSPDALCIGFIDVNSGRTQLELAEASGIPVLAVDSGIENPLIVNICRTDNYQAGAEAARELCKIIGDSGKVALLVHSSQTASGIDREKGFTEEIERNHPEVEIVNVAYRQQEDRNADEIVGAVLTEHPDLKAYFGTNSTVTKELLSAFSLYQEEEFSQIQVAGFDASAKQIEAIEDGKLAGVMAQNPYRMGYAAAVAAFRAAAGMQNASVVDAGHYWITAENVNEEKSQMLIFN